VLAVALKIRWATARPAVLDKRSSTTAEASRTSASAIVAAELFPLGFKGGESLSGEVVGEVDVDPGHVHSYTHREPSEGRLKTLNLSCGFVAARPAALRAYPEDIRQLIQASGA
jgi:hypothetical protein